jgi:hypothetical protein
MLNKPQGGHHISLKQKVLKIRETGKRVLIETAPTGN